MKMKSMLMGVLALGCACAFGGENPTEKTRKAIAKLFPGWTLASEIHPHPLTGFHANHRGQDNVVMVHPKSTETPAIISRAATLSDKNPCLFLKVASWNDAADYLLSVRVNGKDALPMRLVNTPDFAPWEDIVVPLSDWRGSEVKIDVVLTANHWWYENPMIARLEIGEGKGDMRIVEGKATVDGYTWSYRAQNGEATIVAEKDGQFSYAVLPCPIGRISIPATLGGAKVTRIGRGAFKDCSGLTSVTIPEGVVRIGREAFLSCTGLRSVTIPPSVKALDWDAFGNCNALTSVTLSEGLTVIDRGAFYNCFGLTSITIPSSVSYLGQEAFAWCRSLASVQLSQNVTDLRLHAFRGCNALTSVTIPASVTNINFTAFCDTGAMISFRAEAGNRFYKSENGLLLTKDGTTLVRGVNGDVRIPPSVTAIGPCAFEGSVALRSVVIPAGVKSIGHHAFKQCRGMTAVTISERVTSIEDWAFEACSGLTTLKMLGERPNASANVFRGCGKLKAIHVPAKAKSWVGMKEWLGILLVFDGFGQEIEAENRKLHCESDGKIRDAKLGVDKIAAAVSAYMLAMKRTSPPCSMMPLIEPKEGATPFLSGGRQALVDPWGKEYMLCMKGRRFWIASAGPDSRFDTNDDIRSDRNERDEAGEAGKNTSIAGVGGSSQSAVPKVSYEGPYGIRIEADSGCEKGAEYVLKRLVDVYLPSALKYYGDPFAGKTPSRVFTLKVKRNDGSDGRKYTGPSWGSCSDGINQFTIGLAKSSDRWEMDLVLVASEALTICKDGIDGSFSIYVNRFVEGLVKGVDPTSEIKKQIRQGLAPYDAEAEKKDRRLWVWRKFAPMWTVFEKLREKHPTFILDYCQLKNRRYAEGLLPQQLSQEQMVNLLSEVTGEDVTGLLKDATRPISDISAEGKISATEKFLECDFLLNENFKKDAKYYLCLFSASWCGPCRREMPRIAKMYAETLKNNPNIELIHFSRDADDAKALAWAKEHNVKFPVVKPKGGNPLNLQSRGIPHLFIVKADGTLVEEGHPAKLFTEEKLRALK